QLATSDQHGVQLHQHAAGSSAFDHGAGGEIRLDVETEYPGDGRIAIVVAETPPEPWTLSLRVPAWCRESYATLDGELLSTAPVDGYLRRERTWPAQQRVELPLEMPTRITLPDPRIDAVRGCAAVERGPLVYCVEQVDVADGTPVEELGLRTDEPVT